jgi:nicotinate-nucleotide adenylyltransferase
MGDGARIGILGGSFDPVHHGHLIAAMSLMEGLGLDQVRLVVARQQPLKAGEHGASPEDRARMVELAIEGVTGLMVDRQELCRPEPSYTVDTLRALRRAMPEAELVLLLGADAAAELDRWHQPAELRKLARLAVFRRGGEGEADPSAVRVPRLDISSTEIRRRIAAGRSIRYWVPDAVAGYIAERRLYRDGT